MSSKKCLWYSSTISEINGLRTLPEILTDHAAAAIRTVQIMCRKTVERMIDLLENESQIEKNVRVSCENVCVLCEIVRRCTTDY